VERELRRCLTASPRLDEIILGLETLLKKDPQTRPSEPIRGSASQHRQVSIGPLPDYDIPKILLLYEHDEDSIYFWGIRVGA
jgi:hypothetical protein